MAKLKTTSVEGSLSITGNINLSGSTSCVTAPNNYGFKGVTTDGTSDYMLWMNTSNQVTLGYNNRQVKIDCINPIQREGKKLYHEGYKPTAFDISATDQRYLGQITLTGDNPTAGGTNTFTITIPVPSTSSSNVHFLLYLGGTWSYAKIAGTECYSISVLCSGSSPAFQAFKVVPVFNSTHSNFFTIGNQRRDANGVHIDVHYRGESNPIQVRTSYLFGDATHYGGMKIGSGFRGNKLTEYKNYTSSDKPTLSELGAAAASHGNHVPGTQTANNAVFLRNDNTWQRVTPENIGAYTKSEVDSRVNAKLTVAKSPASLDTLTGANLAWHKPGTTGGWPSHSGSHNGVGVLSINTHEGNYYSQLALSTNDNKMFIRSRNNADYTAWQQVYTTQHKPSAGDIGAAPASHPHSNATTSAHGFMSNTDKSKLDGIATGANNYTHPNDANTRHVTDSEKSTWNGKAAGNHTHLSLTPQYTGGGGYQAPNYFGLGLRLNMMNKLPSSNGGYYDCLVLHSYISDVPTCNMLAFSKDGAGRIEYYSQSANNTSWTHKGRVYHSGDKPSAADIGAAAASHTHSYLPLSGGTVSGTVNASALQVSGQNVWSNGNVPLGNSKTGTLTLPNGQRLQWGRIVLYLHPNASALNYVTLPIKPGNICFHGAIGSQNQDTADITWTSACNVICRAEPDQRLKIEIGDCRGLPRAYNFEVVWWAVTT